MNAAERFVHQGFFVNPFVSTHFFSWKQLTMGCAIFAVMLTAFGAIYATETARVWQAAATHNIVEEHRLQIERSQLLLERSVWMAPARIESIAENQLGMIVPTHQSTVIVRE
ncbi:MAG: cell division protein FtsL [Gammaproteobacteria bacterium RIFCSPHIGHO2_12_FULL_42_10]|nr:MAG: cell division protein FtsL [Gammaproteobacteria bacterium RIFCSPHIGHO2_12_FULL_42_10]